jgi:Flp pilus assembly protein TadG
MVTCDPLLSGIYTAIYRFSQHTFTTCLSVSAEMAPSNHSLVTAMSIASIIAQFRSSASRFIRADQGNIAITFGIALLPILGFVGAAVDYTRVSSSRASMQSALDSTALMLSKDLASGVIRSTDIDAKAKTYFAALYTNTNAIVAPADIHGVYTPNSGSASATVAVTGSGTVTTDFLKVAGFPQINFSTASTATWGNSRLRVALALDNTGSMAEDGKMAALIPAAKNLVDQLKATSANAGEVYISIVPFSRDVNVGASNYNASWIDWSEWDQANTSCSGNSGWGNSGWGNWGWGGGGGCNTPSNHNTWNGCVADRDQNYDISNSSPTAASNTKFPAEEYDACPVAMMPLSYDWTALKAKIDTMTPNGNTNQAIGLAWGWQSLTEAAPLNAPPRDANFNYQRAIILMTDGLNTQNHWTSNAGQIDARQRLLCDAIKADGITIYAVQVNTSNDPTQAVLQYCASGASNFYMLTSASQILATFNSIGTSLSKLRIKS